MTQTPETDRSSESLEMPRPTAAPLVMAVGIALLAMGVFTSAIFIVVGALVGLAGLGTWIDQLLPGRGHRHEALVPAARPPLPSAADRGPVEKLQRGMPGYRLRLPVKVHPVSAGIKGGLVAGLVMPLPALAYGLLSGHGLWWPVNLMAGMLLQGMGQLSTAKLEQFDWTYLLVAVAIHFVVSLTLGLLYGVLLPMLPNVPKAMSWGALLMPLLWTSVSFSALGTFNPGLREHIEWPWFLVSQFVFGMVAAIVFLWRRERGPMTAGLLGGLAGGLLMPVPAVLWSLAAGHSIWFPVNVLSAMVVSHADAPLLAELERFRSDWFVAAVGLHLVLSFGFGLAFALVLPRVPAIPGPLAWGGLLLPLLWTGASYSLMGIVNPLLEARVDWPWFIVSQFVFGIVAAIVVVRSVQVHIPPAGPGTAWSLEEGTSP